MCFEAVLDAPPISQPPSVLDPLQPIPGTFRVALLCTQPPPSLQNTNHRSFNRPMRPATVFYLGANTGGAWTSGSLNIPTEKG